MSHERRREILESLQQEARAAADRRRALRASGAILCTGAALIAIVAALPANTPPQSPPRTIAKSPPTPPVAPTGRLDVRVESRQADLADYAMNDAELLAALEDADEPLGVIWTPGDPELISFAKADQPPAAR